MKVKRRDRAYYHGVVFENPGVQETAAYGFTPDTLLLHPDRRQAMGLRYGLEHAAPLRTTHQPLNTSCRFTNS